MPITPLLACIPVCVTFVSIALIGVVVVVFGMSNRMPIDDHPVEGEPGNAVRPPWWIFPVTLLVLVVVFLLIGLIWPDMWG